MAVQTGEGRWITARFIVPFRVLWALLCWSLPCLVLLCRRVLLRALRAPLERRRVRAWPAPSSWCHPPAARPNSASREAGSSAQCCREYSVSQDWSDSCSSESASRSVGHSNRHRAEKERERASGEIERRSSFAVRPRSHGTDKGRSSRREVQQGRAAPPEPSEPRPSAVRRRELSLGSKAHHRPPVVWHAHCSVPRRLACCLLR